jgi:hypothetical protein
MAPLIGASILTGAQISSAAVATAPPGGSASYVGPWLVQCEAALTSVSGSTAPVQARYRLTESVVWNPKNLEETVVDGTGFQFDYARCYIPGGTGGIKTTDTITPAMAGPATVTFTSVSTEAQVRLCVNVRYATININYPVGGWQVTDLTRCNRY